jgi:putative iron-regulated protein
LWRISLLLLLVSCGDDAANVEAPVVRQYAINLHQNYADVVVKVQALQSAVDAFVASPSQAGMDAARQAWLDAHGIYGECEVSRFYAGPIDELQGGMNEWPIDENFIDYTFGNPTGGIINDTVTYPQLTEQVLRAADERGGIENLSTGFHAIEFLLWGQRADQTQGPGDRPYTDYVDGGTHANQDRRRTYLSTVTSMLVSDMQVLTSEWDLGDASSYASKLVAGDPHEGITRMMKGLSQMAIAEIFYERLSDPVITKDRKDEESCFSESTQIDLIANAKGVENVYLGRYGDLQGPSLSDLVRAKDPALDMQMRQQLAAVRAALEAIPPPFDHAVLSPTDSDAYMKVQAALAAFAPVRDTLRAVANALSVQVNL